MYHGYNKELILNILIIIERIVIKKKHIEVHQVIPLHHQIDIKNLKNIILIIIK